MTPHQIPIMNTETIAKEYTRIKDLSNLPERLKTIDLSLFVETVKGLPLTKGSALFYTISTLESLVKCYLCNNILLTSKVSNQETKALAEYGFTSTPKGELKEWKANGI